MADLDQALARTREPARRLGRGAGVPDEPRHRSPPSGSSSSPRSDPLVLESGATLGAGRGRLRDLRDARRRPRQRGRRLPRADRRRARRRLPPGRRPAGLVGHAHRPGQAARHRPAVRGLREPARRLPGDDRPVLDRPARRGGPTARASRCSPSATSSRCTARSSSATSGSRRLRWRPSAGRSGGCRSCSGRSTHPDELARRGAGLRDRAADGPEHRLPRDRARGDHPRPRLPRRRLLRAAGARPELGLVAAPAWSATSRICPSRRWSAQVRAPAAGRRAHPPTRLRRRLRRRELPAPPGRQSFLRRFDANTYLYYTRVMDYFDPFGEPARRARACAGCATRFLLLSFTATGASGRAHTRAHRRAAARPPASPHDRTRSTAPTGTTRSCFALPEYHRLVAAFLTEVHAGGRGAPTPAT